MENLEAAIAEIKKELPGMTLLENEAMNTHTSMKVGGAVRAYAAPQDVGSLSKLCCILKEHGLGLKEIQDTIAKIDPMPGAKEFLDELRSICQVIIISDTFSQFAGPLMKKLGMPTIFCNTLEVAPDGEITGFKMRCEQSKLTTVKALQSIGYDTIASGDSYNDLGMIKASKAGFLFKSTDKIKNDNPELPAYETYEELMAAIKKVLD